MDILETPAHLHVSHYRLSRRFYCRELHGYTSAVEIMRHFRRGALVTVLEAGRDVTTLVLLRALVVAVDTDAVRLTPEQLRELVK